MALYYISAAKGLSDSIWTSTRAGYLDNISEAHGQYHDKVVSVYPKDAARVACQSGGGAWTAGAWTEIVPASTITKDILILGVDIRKATVDADYDFQLAIGTGAAASESEKARVSHAFDWTSNVGYGASSYKALAVPIKVAANTRIAGKCNCDTATKTINVNIVYIEMS